MFLEGGQRHLANSIAKRPVVETWPKVTAPYEVTNSEICTPIVARIVKRSGIVARLVLMTGESSS